MDSITAAVVGGASMAGGVGLLSGTVAGAFLIGMLSNIMNNLAVNQFYQYVLKGGLLVVAMIAYSISNLLEVKRHEERLISGTIPTPRCSPCFCWASLC